MIKLIVRGHLPNELAQAWLQHLRDFDAKHPGCHFEVVADAADMAIDAMVDVLRGIDPPFADLKVINKR